MYLFIFLPSKNTWGIYLSFIDLSLLLYIVETEGKNEVCLKSPICSKYVVKVYLFHKEFFC